MTTHILVDGDFIVITREYPGLSKGNTWFLSNSNNGVANFTLMSESSYKYSLHGDNLVDFTTGVQRDMPSPQTFLKWIDNVWCVRWIQDGSIDVGTTVSETLTNNPITDKSYVMLYQPFILNDTKIELSNSFPTNVLSLAGDHYSIVRGAVPLTGLTENTPHVFRMQSAMTADQPDQFTGRDPLGNIGFGGTIIQSQSNGMPI